jgi:hypothetical protein
MAGIKKKCTWILPIVGSVLRVNLSDAVPNVRYETDRSIGAVAVLALNCGNEG